MELPNETKCYFRCADCRPDHHSLREWLETDLTLVTVPGVGHFVQNAAAEFVSAMMKSWLEVQSSRP